MLKKYLASLQETQDHLQKEASKSRSTIHELSFVKSLRADGSLSPELIRVEDVDPDELVDPIEDMEELVQLHFSFV